MEMVIYLLSVTLAPMNIKNKKWENQRKHMNNQTKITFNNGCLTVFKQNFFVIFSFAILIILCKPSFAITVQDVVVNANKNNSITIDLSDSVSDEGSGFPLLLTILSLPTNGSASVEAGLSIRYTPTNGFVGSDQLTYSVNDGISDTKNAIIRISVGTIIDLPEEGARVDTLEISITDTLNDICSIPSNSTSLLAGRCNELALASEEERQLALREIAPEEIATQNKAGDTQALNQLRGIGKRLSALRAGSRGVSLNNFSFNINQQKISANDIGQVFFNQENYQALTENFGLLSRKLGIFVSGNIGNGSRVTTKKEDGFNYDTQGVTIGADYRLSNQLIFGIASAFAKTELDISDNGGKLDVTGISFITYGTYYLNDKLFFDVIFTVSKNDFDTIRNINYTAAGNTINAVANSNASSQLNALSIGGGYSIIENRGFNVLALGNFDYLASRIDAYAETGANELNLNIDDRDFSSALASMGLQFSYPFSQRWGVVVPQLNVSWEYDLSPGSDVIKGSFANDVTGKSFEFNTDEADNNYFRTEIGASFILPGGLNAFILYETILQKTYTKNNNLSFGGRYELAF